MLPARGMGSGTRDDVSVSPEAAPSSSGWPALFWEAFRQSNNAMLLLDENRCHVDVNGAYLAAIGYRRAELLGRPIFELVAGGPLLSAAEWRETLRQKQFTGVADMIRADGKLVRVEFGGHPELVTGRRLVLFVALRTTRRSRQFSLEDEPQSGATLSERELEVVRLIAAGFSSPEIAQELHVSHNTVRSHARNSMIKVGARSRAQLVAKSLGDGLLW